MTPPLRAWAEIEGAALAQNVALLRERFAPARVLAVLKADAYGHGLPLVAPLCAALGLRDFGVATPAEGAALRALVPAGARVYLLGPFFPEEAPAVAFHRLTPLLSSLEAGSALSQAAQAQGVAAEAHLDINTGIGRAGISPDAALASLAVLDTLPGLHVSGVATHFASADEDPRDACAQHLLFESFLRALGTRAMSLLVHASNSPASLNLPAAARHGLVRPGLLLYGIEPVPGLFRARGLPCRPVLSLRARVTLCRRLAGGETISYGRTYTVPPGGGVYATLGVGYGDGYPRGLSNRGCVLLHGRRAPIRGRVCMDQVVVDVSDIPNVRASDIATLVGLDGSEALTAGDLAAWVGTTPHEISTALTARVPRLLVPEGSATDA